MADIGRSVSGVEASGAVVVMLAVNVYELLAMAFLQHQDGYSVQYNS
jgi:hypothetical protein